MVGDLVRVNCDCIFSPVPVEPAFWRNTAETICRSILDPDCSILHTSPPGGKVDGVADWGGSIKWMEGGSKYLFRLFLELSNSGVEWRGR